MTRRSTDTACRSDMKGTHVTLTVLTRTREACDSRSVTCPAFSGGYTLNPKPYKGLPYGSHKDRSTQTKDADSLVVRTGFRGMLDDGYNTESSGTLFN